MQFEITSEFINSFKKAIEEKNNVFLKEQLNEFYAQDIAIIINQLNLGHASYLFELIEDDIAADVLLELDEDKREDLLATFSSKEIAEQLDNMESDDAADVIAELPQNIQEEVLSHIEDIEQASDIAELINFEEGTAGSLMAKELVSIYAFETVTACIEQIRKQTDNVDVLYAVYVVDNNERLIGMLSLKKLIMSHPLARVDEIYEPDIQFVKTSTTSDEVSEIMQKYDLVVLPVVDQLGRLVGRITIDDVFDVIRETADENIQRMSGISDDVDSNDKIWRLSRARIPWLLVGMCGGIVGSRIIGGYEEEIKIHPEMAYFIPLIGAMGGNVGVQSSAIIVQGLANNTLLGDNILPKLGKELGVGIINGLICSALICGYSFLIEDWQLAATVSVALFTVIIFASFLGTFVPLTMNRFKINPALATGPFVTTLNDIIGITIYFLMGRLLYTSF
ncbi:MAG: magnesium transporter [Bacteroidota bacterium]|nr:magnesium transporter [Bacteroidota bacterium]MDP3146070.1 magnesium transporter [Bacteroidota bacterium]MDP3558606.1 magnesium transporter [Bacteroidota bacterium]